MCPAAVVGVIAKEGRVKGIIGQMRGVENGRIHDVGAFLRILPDRHKPQERHVFADIQARLAAGKAMSWIIFRILFPGQAFRFQRRGNGRRVDVGLVITAGRDIAPDTMAR